MSSPDQRKPASRAAGRWLLLRRAALHGLATRQRPETPRRILVAHHLLLGDTLMLAALFARLRARYPQAEIVTTVPTAFVPLFSGRPWGVEAIAHDPRDAGSLQAFLRAADAGGGFDLALIPGDNRYALLARAAGARWIVALAGDRPGWKNRLCDELVPMPAAATALAEIFASLAGPDCGARCHRGDWPMPACTPFEQPTGRYAVLHLGAGSPLRHWAPRHWRALADHLAAHGVTPVWSAGIKETALAGLADPARRFPDFSGRLDLPQLWHLLAGAALLVCPDTGVAHLGKVVGVPTLCLFGPGSPALFGRGGFWADAPFVALGPESFPCRDQRTLFKRELAWVRRCQRGPAECAEARCMGSIEPAAVIDAADILLAPPR